MTVAELKAYLDSCEPSKTNLNTVWSCEIEAVTFLDGGTVK